MVKAQTTGVSYPGVSLMTGMPPCIDRLSGVLPLDPRINRPVAMSQPGIATCSVADESSCISGNDWSRKLERKH